MRIIRVLGNIALWLGAALGVVAGSLWVAGQLGMVQPLIVISGSMEPEISTGDLLFATATPADQLEVGDVVSLESQMTDKLVTHRITEITPVGDGSFSIEMQGDANDEPDLETYTVSGDVWTPVVQISGGGDAVSKLMEPAVVVPILVALFALFALSLLDEEDAAVERRDVPTTGPGGDPDGVEGAEDGVDVRGLATTLDDPLDELDRALAALGVDVDAYLAPGSDVGEESADRDERELVLTG